MTREEAIKHITTWMYATTDLPPVQVAEAFDMAIAALRSPAREQVEKVWRGKWALVPNGVGGKQYMCSKCGGSEYEYWRRHFAHGNENFCPHCGAPMTDKAVDMVMKRLEALYETVE